MIIVEPKNKQKQGTEKKSSDSMISLLMILFFIAGFIWLKIVYNAHQEERVYVAAFEEDEKTEQEVPKLTVPTLDKDLYDKKLYQLAHRTIATTTLATTTVATSTNASSTKPAKPITYLWPVKTVYPNYGAVLPFNRIVAYYGNFYSKQMGVLGEYAPDIVLGKLREEVKRWEVADPTTPVIPAIHYIAAVAQASAGTDGDYLARMPYAEIDKAIDMAKQIDALVFLDIQIAHSDVQQEVAALNKYLALPQVHLGIDAEFAMQDGKRPGTVIGTLDASDINQAAQMLAKIVRENNLPPKVLIVHRFTEGMITNYQNIRPLPEVQIVMTMDGWGSPELKTATYKHVIYPEPVQFTGFKLFYKNDLRKPSTRMLTPEEILRLTPSPSYVQYQ